MKGLNLREITSLSMTKSVMNMEHHFNYCPKKPHAHHKTQLHTMKVYNTQSACLPTKILLTAILLLFLTTEIFTCSKEINAFKR